MNSFIFSPDENSLPDDLKYEDNEDIDLEKELTEILIKNNGSDLNVL